jgi:hypothetical protein
VPSVVSAGGDVSIEAMCVHVESSCRRIALDPQLFQFVGLGVKSAVAGGSAARDRAKPHNSVDCQPIQQFVDSSVVADQMCGGAVAFVAMQAMIRGYVYDSSFVRSSHVGMRSNGISVALVDWSEWQSVLEIQGATFVDTVVTESDNVEQLQGAAAVAFQLGIDNCTVSGFNITLTGQYGGEVSGGVFSGSYVGATDLVMTDNVFAVGNGASGVLIGPYQNSSLKRETWCNFVNMDATLVARNTLAVTTQMYMSLVRSTAGTSCGEIRDRLPHGYAYTNVRSVLATQNRIDGQAIELNAPISMFELDSDELVLLDDCTFTNNTWNSYILRIVASGADLRRSNFSENNAPDHHVVLARVTESLHLVGVQMLLNGDTRGGLMGISSGANISHSAFVSRGGIAEALRIDGAAPDSFGLNNAVIIEHCDFRHAGVTLLAEVSNARIENSTFVDAPVVGIVTAVDEVSTLFERRIDFGLSTFVNCSPAFYLRSVEFGSVLGQQESAGVDVTFDACKFDSALDATARPIFQVECDGAILTLRHSHISALAQSVGSMQSELLNVVNCSIVGSSGINLVSGNLEISNSSLRNVIGNVVLATSNASMVLSQVDVGGCGPIAAHGMESVVLDQVSIGNSTLAASAIDVSRVQTLLFTDVRVLGVLVAGVGTVKLSHVGNATLTNVTVDSCTAIRGGAFAAGDLGTLACSNARAVSNRALVAGGAVFVEDASANQLFDCLLLANNTADAYGSDRASAQLHLNVTRGSDAPPMPGVGLLQLHVALVDEFGQRQRRRTNGGLLPLRDAELTVRANLSCDAHGNTTRREVFVCLIGDSDDGCVVDVPLPAAARCVVDFAAPPVRGAQLNVSLTDCAFGFGVESTDSPLCVACLPDSTAIGGNSSCRACPPGARCCGAARVFAEPEHFLVESAASSALVAQPCLPGVCLGSNVSCSDARAVVGARDEPLNVCAPFRGGLLCASCNDTRLIPIAPDNAGGGACLECAEFNIALIVLAMVGLALGAVVIHLNTAGSSAALKILLYYTQVAGLQASGGLVSEVMSTVFGFRIAAASGSFGGVCIAPLNHFGLVMSRLCLPFVLLALLLLVATVSVLSRACWRRACMNTSKSSDSDEERDDDDGNDDGVPSKSGAVVPLAIGDNDKPAAAPSGLFSRQRLFRTSVAIVLLTFSVALEASLDVLHCVTIGNDSLLSSDVRESCSTSTALIWQRAAMFGFLPLGGLVIVSVVGALLLLRRANGSRLPASHPVLGVLFECYAGERARVLWEAFVLVRRLAIGLISVFVASFPLKHFLFTLVNTASLLATIFERPFADNAENHLDIVAQMFLVLLGGVVVERDSLGDGFRTFIVVLTTAPVFVIVGFMCRARFVQLRAWLLRRKMKK